MTRAVTAEVRSLIEKWEGCPLYAYDDAAYPTRAARSGDRIKGTLTIGAGHTGPDVHVSMTISQAQADQLLDADLAKCENDIAVVVHVPLNDNQYGALVSFAFNCGTAAFNNSTLLRKLNTGDYGAVPGELAKWVHTTIGGKTVVSPGLVTRRANEAALWVKPVIGVSAPSTITPNSPPIPIEPSNWLSVLIAAILSLLRRKA